MGTEKDTRDADEKAYEDGYDVGHTAGYRGRPPVQWLMTRTDAYALGYQDGYSFARDSFFESAAG